MDFDDVPSLLDGFVSSDQNNESKPLLEKLMLCKEKSLVGSDDFNCVLHQQNSSSDPLLQGSDSQLLTSNFSSNQPQGNYVQNSLRTSTAPPYHHHSPSSAFGSSSSSSSGNSNIASINRPPSPLTPAQRMELELQALIYRYISARFPVPPNLLTPIRQSLKPYALYGSPSAFTSPTSLGWSNPFLSYLASTSDPEPGRCRRTDGKKWRCAKNALSQQKYCEKHMNRGRQRSRKPVELQTGYPAVTSTETTNSEEAVELPVGTSMPQPAVSTDGGVSNSLVITQQKQKNLVPDEANSSEDAPVKRCDKKKRNIYGTRKSQDLKGVSSTANLKSDHSTIILPEQNMPIQESSQSELLKSDQSTIILPEQNIHIQESPQSEFGLVSPDSFIALTQTCESFDMFNDWPQELQYDWTQLSVSLPMLLSASSSPMHEKPGSLLWDDCTNIQLGNSPNGVLQNGFLSSDYDSTQLGFSPNGVLLNPISGSESNGNSGSSPKKDGVGVKNNGDCLLYDYTIASPSPI